MLFHGFIIQILIVGIIVGLILWLIDLIPSPPLDATIKRIIHVIVIIIFVLWLLSILIGWLPNGGTWSYPRGH